jgi:NOL1/NOP2/fmu family ribosome biogenesis protein
LNRNFFYNMQLDESSALQYLRKETIPSSSRNKGFALVTFENTCLGWVNILDNRINNLYPSEWRIRMR